MGSVERRKKRKIKIICVGSCELVVQCDESQLSGNDDISPSLYNLINLINSNILSDEYLMMAGISRNMQLLSSYNKHN